MSRFLFIVPALALAGCATTAMPLAAANRAECRNEGLEAFVGQPASAATGSEMLRVSGARTLQWIGHGQMVTMEFNPARVRVQLDSANRIQSARCG